VTLPLPLRMTVTGADWKMEPDQSYDIELALRGDAALEFTSACLTAHGANPTCAELQSELQQYGAFAPYISQLTCLATSDGGCGCSWTLAPISSDVGNWHTADQVVDFDSTVTETTAAFDVCASSDTLALTWLPNSQFGAASFFGLRTLSLKRAQ
jgi:hypothetical protein